MKSITTVVDDYIHLCSDYGLSPNTICQKRDRYCQPIIDYFTGHNKISFDTELISTYLTKYENKLNNNQISQKYFNAVKKTVLSLIDIALTGTTNIGRICNYKKYPISCDLEDLINCILDQVNYQPDYRYKHACCLRKFFYHMIDSGKTINDINDQMLIRYITVIAKNTNAGSMDYVINSLHLLALWLNQKSGKISINIKAFRPKALPKRLIAPFTHEEISRIIKVIDITTPIGKRDIAIILLSYTTGLRAIDICKLKLKDIEWKKQTIVIQQSKTMVKIVIPVPGYVLNKIADYILNGRPISDLQEVFLTSLAPYRPLKSSRSIDRIFEKYCQKAHIEKQYYRSFHSLRRSFATELSKNQTTVTTVSQLLGHTSFASARRYLSYDDSTLKECVTGFNEVPIKYGIYSNDSLPPVCTSVAAEALSSFYTEIVNQIPSIQGGVYGI